MSSNFEWQRQQVNERIQGAIHEAASHRLSRKGSPNRPFLATAIKAVVFVGVVWFLVGVVLAGCTPAAHALAVEAPSQASVHSGALTTRSVADRIRFQDRWWEQLLSSGGYKPEVRFMDRWWEQNTTSNGSKLEQTTPTWTSADRIRFQDRQESHP